MLRLNPADVFMVAMFALGGIACGSPGVGNSDAPADSVVGPDASDDQRSSPDIVLPDGVLDAVGEMARDDLVQAKDGSEIEAETVSEVVVDELSDACLPSCENWECGPDGCGGECGVCSGTQDVCIEGLCVCQAACLNKACGDDGCGSSCGECDDGFFCTTDTCADGLCEFLVQQYYCLLDSECVPSGIDKMENPCRECRPEMSQIEWSPIDDSTPCGVGKRCYLGECCEASLNCEGLECGDDGCGGSCGSCPEHYECQQSMCLYVPWCGDDNCDANEACDSCVDCGMCCGNGVCNMELGEDCSSCSLDCACALCGESCIGGTCTFTACITKECGGDECGGICGVCENGHDCVEAFGFATCVQRKTEEHGLVWIAVDGGTYQMGCSVSDAQCLEHEKPGHTVTVSSFEILETEVTEAQFLAVVGFDPSCDYTVGGGPDSPVECVSWSAAKSFCEAIGGRLPTEAEWEYAARGGTATTYTCGEDGSCLSEIAWFTPIANLHKHDVKTLNPNTYGLFDMLGNVWEWTSDWYSNDYFANSPQDNPPGPADGTTRVVRGGSFGNPDFGLRVSVRYGVAPNPSGDYDGKIGFRCARDSQ